MMQEGGTGAEENKAVLRGVIEEIWNGPNPQAADAGLKAAVLELLPGAVLMRRYHQRRVHILFFRRDDRFAR